VGAGLDPVRDRRLLGALPLARWRRAAPSPAVGRATSARDYEPL